MHTVEYPEPIKMRYDKGLSQREIAKRMDLPLSRIEGVEQLKSYKSLAESYIQKKLDASETIPPRNQD